MDKGKDDPNVGQTTETKDPTTPQRGMSRAAPPVSRPRSLDSQNECILRQGVIDLTHRNPRSEKLRSEGWPPKRNAARNQDDRLYHPPPRTILVPPPNPTGSVTAAEPYTSWNQS